MLAFSKGERLKKEGTAITPRKARNKVVKAFEAELKGLVRNFLKSFMREEQAKYVEIRLSRRAPDQEFLLSLSQSSYLLRANGHGLSPQIAS